MILYLHRMFFFHFQISLYKKNFLLFVRSPTGKRLIFAILKLVFRRLVAASKPSSAAQARQLEATLSSARKLLRLGTCIDSLRSSVASVGHPDIVLRVTITLSRISNAMFLLCDHFVWLHRAKVINVDVDGWNELSNRWWLYGDIMNLARDIYEVQREGSFIWENKPLLLDLVKNLADIILPLAALGDLSYIFYIYICFQDI